MVARAGVQLRWLVNIYCYLQRDKSSNTPKSTPIWTQWRFRRGFHRLETSTVSLADIASDENSGISRVFAEVDDGSCELIETLSAMTCSPMYERVRAEVKVGNNLSLDLFATRMYLVGRFDQRRQPFTR